MIVSFQNRIALSFSFNLQSCAGCLRKCSPYFHHYFYSPLNSFINLVCGLFVVLRKLVVAYALKLFNFVYCMQPILSEMQEYILSNASSNELIHSFLHTVLNFRNRKLYKLADALDFTFKARTVVYILNCTWACDLVWVCRHFNKFRTDSSSKWLLTNELSKQKHTYEFMR